MPRHHLLAVWNPVYGRDVMEAHLRVLQQAVREYRAGRCSEDDVYVWWGKVRSQSRMAPLPHLDDVLAIERELDRNEEGPETHVYLTDFQSLYVAHLGKIQVEDPHDVRDERKRMPSYYHQKHEDLTCDFWFQLWDIRRLVSSDVATVVHDLRKLRNTRHHDRPVSIYGGMVDLPLIVTETEAMRYFDPEFRDTYNGGRFWVESDSERSGVGAIEGELRENLFGDTAWQAFGATSRMFIATGERLYREHAQDPGFDLSSMLIEFCKALEVRCNWLLRRVLTDAPAEVRSINVGGDSVDVSGKYQLTLRQLSKFIGGSRDMAEYLRKHLVNGDWFAGQLPSVLNELADVRGEAAHTQAIERQDAIRWRNRLMGVGCEGEFVRLSRVRPKG